MEGITHKMITINGINMHIAEMGKGPIVLLLHGFPELWYSWRHQIPFLAANGYRGVAPDLRGYGDTAGAPVSDPTKFTTMHIVGDVVALIDALGADKVFVVGHDWGALIAWKLCLLRPDKVKALISLCVHFVPRNPARKVVESFRAMHGDDHYICRFQEPGEMEAVFASLGTKQVLKKLLTYHDPEPWYFPKDNPFGDEHDTPIVLPPWLTEEDIDYYTNKFEQTGFTGGMNYYRCFDLNWELEAAWTNAKIRVPVKFVVGELDLVYNIPNAKEYIHNGGFHKHVPLLEEVVVIEGAAHFINQEVPDKEPGEMEAVFASLGTKQVLKKLLTYHDPEPWYFPKDNPFGDEHDTPIVLPSWLTEEDIDYYTNKFEQTGFTGGMNYYPCFDLNWELEAAWTNAKISVPVKFVVGELDFVYNIPHAKEYIHNGGFHKHVPLLEEVVVIEGAAHFINQETPDKVNKHIFDFLQKF